MTKKIFIDLGTHYFAGLYEFITKLNIDKSWDVICFEPQKDVFKNGFKNNIAEFVEKFNKFEYYNKAVMDYNGKIMFNYHRGAWSDTNIGFYNDQYNTGSNCIIENPKRDEGDGGVIFDIFQEEVECIDIEDILKKIADNNKNNDYEIYMKCDIEGSEFKVLPKLLKSEHINKFKEIYVEWHERYFLKTDYYKDILKQKDEIINEMKEKNINHIHHH